MVGSVWRGGAVAAVLALSLIAVAARPNQDFFLGDRRPVYRGQRTSKSETAEVIVESNINVVGEGSAGVARSTAATPTLGESVQMVTKQLLQDPQATDMVATDVRTPPRVKTRLEEASGTPHAQLLTATPAPPPRVTTSSGGGLSTWILLSNGELSTPPSSRRPPSTAVPKKTPSTVRPTATIEKVVKKGNDSKVEKIPPSASPLTATKKPDTTPKPVPYDSKFKNRTPIIVGRVPSPKNKTEPVKKVPSTQVPVTTLDPVTKKKPTPSISMNKHTIYIPESVPTTSLLLESNAIEPETKPTTETPSTSTKKTKRPSTKTKKKKNKVRRRRPTKDSQNAQSKIDTDVAETKIEGFNRPLSTRIYNYLAREVMPNVGVGIVGLMLTAGIAGLLLYPFGGVAARRNYEKIPPQPDRHIYYSHHDYNPVSNDAASNVQPEENVFGQVLGQGQAAAYSPVYDSQNKYNNHYRYDIQEYANENVNGYAGMKDYSTLPDSVKNQQFSALAEGTKFYNMDPMAPISPQYKEGETTKEVNANGYDDAKYPSFNEYTAYTSASAVGTGAAYDKSNLINPTFDNSHSPPYDNAQGATYDIPLTASFDNVHISHTEDAAKSDVSTEKEPQYSALSSNPTYPNTDFVGSVSVSGSYGAELGHRTGMLPMDHGPRSMGGNKRPKRQADDLNEIDVDDEVIKSSISSVSTVPSIDSTTTRDQETTTKDSVSNEVDGTTENIVDPKESTTVSSPPQDEVKAEINEINDYQDNEIGAEKPTESSVEKPVDDFSFMGILKRLFQLKMRVGINLIRSTSEALHRYMNRVTERMEVAVKNMGSRAPSYSSGFISRKRRDLSKHKSAPVKKYKQH